MRAPPPASCASTCSRPSTRSEEHTSELQSHHDLVCRLLLEKKKANKEIQYLNAKDALTYTDIAGDPVLYGNLPPREIYMKEVFRSVDTSKKFTSAEGKGSVYSPS